MVHAKPLGSTLAAKKYGWFASEMTSSVNEPSRDQDPNQLGPEYNLHVLESFAEHVAPALGWKPNTEGRVQGDPVA